MAMSEAHWSPGVCVSPTGLALPLPAPCAGCLQRALTELRGRATTLKHARPAASTVLASQLFHPEENLPESTIEKYPARTVWSQWGNDKDELWFRAIYNPAVRYSRAFTAVRYCRALQPCVTDVRYSRALQPCVRSALPACEVDAALPSGRALPPSGRALGRHLWPRCLSGGGHSDEFPGEGDCMCWRLAHTITFR